MDIGRAVLEIRKENQIKQVDLADKCGLSVVALCNIEKGRNKPSFKTVELLASQLGVSTGYLIFRALDEEDIEPDKRNVFQVMKRLLI
ncbi:MAG: helix-turn-helix transcriptional regulator [Bacteroidaceae bacterium]|nr:helix-turn-helix transcriptional regulator [Bacteroidaceae bacterium]